MIMKTLLMMAYFMVLNNCNQHKEYKNKTDKEYGKKIYYL